MAKAIDYFINKIENWKLSFVGGFLIFLISVFLRYLIEGLVGVREGGRFLPVSDFFHFLLWYGLDFLAAAAIISIFSGKKINFSFKVVAIFFPGIALPVVFAFIFGESITSTVSYINVSSFSALFEKMLTFFVDGSFSVSLRFVAATSVLSLSFLIYALTKKWIKAVLCFIVSYALLFFAGSLPSFINIFQNNAGLYPKPFLMDLFYNHFGEILIGRGYFSEMNIDSLNIWLSFILDSVLFPFVVFAVGLAVYIYKKNWFPVIIKNLRAKKGINFAFAFFIGIAVSAYLYGTFPPINFLNITAIVNIFLVGILSYGAAAFFDDIYDKDPDSVVHPRRPLISGKISESESLKISAGLAILSLAGSLVISFYFFIFNLIALFIVFIYSYRGIRLKRFFILNTFLITIVFLFFIIGGFFSFSPSRHLFDFPMKFAIFFFSVMFLSVALKDISDYNGDVIGQIKTLPVVFGIRKSQFIIGVLLFLLTIIFPFVLGKWSFVYLYVLSFLFAPIFFYLTVQKNFSEKKLYLAGVIFFALSAFFIFFV